MFNLLSRERWITPFSFTVIVFWMIFGALLMASSATTAWAPSPAIAATPPLVQFGIGLFIAGGGAMILMAGRPWKQLNTGWMLERVGALLAFGGWIAYSASALVQDWKHTGVIMLGIMMATAILTRYGESSAQEKFIRTRVKKLWASGYPRNL